jgi:hypothetical protein
MYTPHGHILRFFNLRDAQFVTGGIIYSVVDPNTARIQVLELFQASIELGAFHSGHYSV